MLLEWEIWKFISLFSLKVMSHLLFIESISSDTTHIDVKWQCYTASGWKIYVRIFLNIYLCFFVDDVVFVGKSPRLMFEYEGNLLALFCHKTHVAVAFYRKLKNSSFFCASVTCRCKKLFTLLMIFCSFYFCFFLTHIFLHNFNLI